MSNVLVCQGAYAENPYYIKDDCRSIYSVEELCYYLYHTAYLLDDRFVTSELADWIINELQLPEVGREVSRICGKSEALSKLVVILGNNIGYYTEEEWKALLSDIGRNNKLTVEERLKKRADGFLTSGKYAMALEEYERIIQDTKVDQVKFRACVFHNMGISAAKLFLFETAADDFRRAYECYPNTDSYVSMLCSMKMYMTPSEYLQFLSEHKESYEDSLEVERRFEYLKVNWKSQPAKRFIDEISELKRQGSAYYDGINSMAEEAKMEYREFLYNNKV